MTQTIITLQQLIPIENTMTLVSIVYLVKPTVRSSVTEIIVAVFRYDET